MTNDFGKTKKKHKTPKPQIDYCTQGNVNLKSADIGEIAGAIAGTEVAQMGISYLDIKAQEAFALGKCGPEYRVGYLENSPRQLQGKLIAWSFKQLGSSLKKAFKFSTRFVKSIPEATKNAFSKIKSDVNVVGRYKDALNSKLQSDINIYDPAVIKNSGEQVAFQGSYKLEEIPDLIDSDLIKNNTPKDFSKLQPSKLDELKNPQVQGISGSVSDATTIGMEIIQPQPIILPKKTTSWLSQFGSILSGVSSLIQHGVGVLGGMGGLSGARPNIYKSVYAEIQSQSSQIPSGPTYYYNGYDGSNIETWLKNNPMIRHTGGTVTPKSGRDEVLAILRGGETVRTEAQEKELQEEKQKAFMETIRPYLEQKEDKPKTIAEAYDPNNKIPCLLNKTIQDEELIISIIAKAWKSNRLGFRNVLRYE